MYVTLLASALGDWAPLDDPHAVFEHAQRCRREMLLCLPSRCESSYAALAAQVSYDRSLIKLCEALRIASPLANFSRPREERRRLEVELANVGFDLTTAT